MSLPSYYPFNARDRATGQRVHVAGDPFTVPMPGFAHRPEGHASRPQASVIFANGKLRLIDPDRLEPLEARP